MDLTNRIALVTGGARRVGRTIALALARRGAHVAFTYQTSRQEAKSLVRELTALGGKSLAVKADLRRAADAKGAVRARCRAWGGSAVISGWGTPWSSMAISQRTARAS